MCRALLFLLYLFQILLVVRCQYQNRRPSVRLPQGTLIGTKVYSDSGKIADTFFGIPYAAPPTGNLRFAPPQRHHGWNGTLNALNYGPQCPQLPFRPGSSGPGQSQSQTTADNEDCLYLNIWAPETALRYGPVPVVIVFEGVDFARSNHITIPGQDLAMEGVVTVTLNYRMNVFGFLSLGTMELRGNYGLIDQYFAMIWVRENIKYFGGDPEKITLFGYSAGSASVAYHMISPRTSGLFQRIIMSSGSVLSPWHLATNEFKSSEKIIHLLGCQSDYPNTMMQCLRSKRTVDILKAYEEYIDAGNIPDGFIPVIDTFLPESDRYLPTEPVNAFKEGTFAQVPILTGIAQVITDPQFTQWENIGNQGAVQLQQYFEQSKIPEVITKYHFTSQNREEIVEMIKWRYVTSSQRNVRNLLQQMKAFEYEVKIEAPHIIQLNHLVGTYLQPIYVYHIDDFGLTLDNNVSESLITSDIILLFGPFLLNQMARRRFNANEMRYSKKFKQLVTNFIIFGNPTPNTNVKIWKKYAPNDYFIERLDIQSYDDEIKRARRISFWTQLLPKLSNPNFNSNDNPRELHLSPDPAAGFRHAMYTLVGLVIALLALLFICVVLLKRRSKETERHLHMGY